MSLVAMGTNYKSSKLETLERISVSKDEFDAVVGGLRSAAGVDGAVVLSTCNRVEAYVDARTDRMGADALRAFFAERLGQEPPRNGFYLERGEDVVHHLFRVVCSLDSQVLGEAQILGQTRGAFDRSVSLDCCTEVLMRLFRDALHVGKRVRSETAIGGDSVSLSTTAVKVARQEFSDIADRQVLFIGVGEMALLTLRYLMEDGVTDFLVTSRTLEHAREFATRCDARCYRFEDRYDAIAKADIVFTMTSSPGAVVEAEPLAKARREVGAAKRKLVFVDEAVPRDVAASCCDVEGVSLYNLDSLNSIVDDGLASRMTAVGDVEQLVAQAEEDFLAWMQQRSVVPTVKAMYAKGNATVDGELQKASKLMAREFGRDLHENELAVLESFGNAVMKKVLHGPAVRLKKESETADSYYYTGAARYLFGLDTYPPGCTPHSCESRACLEGQPCPQGFSKAMGFAQRAR